MPSTTAYDKWDIILVPFPFTDLTSTKRRPALIVSPDSYNVGNDVIVAFITSQLNTPARMGDYQLKHWQAAGLPKPSMVRMKFATVEKSIIIRKLGRLDDEDESEIRKGILSFFTL